MPQPRTLRRVCVFTGLFLFFLSFFQTEVFPGWISQTIDSIGCSTLNSGWYEISGTVDSQGYLHVSYYDETNQDLKYATNATGAWTVQTLDSVGNVGSQSAIAVDTAIHVHIVYWDTTNGRLRYATNAAGYWLYQTVDANSTGYAVSIAADAGNRIHISYYNNQTSGKGSLKYATNGSGAWVTQTVEETGGYVGAYNSLVLDSAGHAHIAYTDSDNWNLKYATNKLGTWATAVLDSGNFRSYTDTAIARDTSDHIHISYYDYTNHSLKYANNANGSWIAQTIATTPDGTVGKSSSIKVDASNHVHISYVAQYGCYPCKHSLNHATNASGGWITQTVDGYDASGMDTAINVIASDEIHIIYTSKNAAGCSGSDPSKLKHAEISDCTVSFYPHALAFNAQGGIGSVAVTASATGCLWPAFSNEAWITVTGGTGAGSGSLGFSVSENNTLDQRSGTITIVGENVTITQYPSGYTLKGDIDDDLLLTISDAVLALRVVAGLPVGNINFDAVVNAIGKPGLLEVIYVLQHLSGLRADLP